MVRFVLLGLARSGTTLLTMALAQHPAVHIFGEIFNVDKDMLPNIYSDTLHVDRVGKPASSDMINSMRHYVDGEDITRYMEDNVYYEHALNDAAVGFKLLYNQVASVAKLWEYLADRKDIRVIHVTRTNLLASYLSLTIASSTG
jgi:hypothetical protein